MSRSPSVHPEWEAFLLAIRATPHDDLPRLVAADWLDEHGEPERAEFIRIQCTRARQDKPELQWREQALLSHPLFGPLWAVEACPNIVTLQFLSESGSPLRSLGVASTDRVQFVRGFPYRVRCTAAEWLKFGPGVVPRQPIFELELTECDDVPRDDWWEMLATLKLMTALRIDCESLYLPTWLRNRLGEDVCISIHGEPAPLALIASTPSRTSGTFHQPVELDATSHSLMQRDEATRT